MHDIRWIRNNPSFFDSSMAKRKILPMADQIISLDSERRKIQTELQIVKTRRNVVSKEIGIRKKSNKSTEILVSEVVKLKEKILPLEQREAELAEQIDKLLSEIPNIPSLDVPIGDNEKSNLEIKKFGVPPVFHFQTKDHVDLGVGLGLMNFEQAGKLSGARFVVLRGVLAKFERAISSFMLDVHTREFGYIEISPPILVRREAMYGTGQLPKFADDLFQTTNDFWLIPTAEVPLTNLLANEIINKKELPIRMTALTPCFRSEAGAAGKDTRGMLRQHQFNKVELVSICHPDESEKEHERMTNSAEEILRKLELPYRIVILCTGDLGFSSNKTFDIEVWLPGQKKYREISSCSNCGEFQARRMLTRFQSVEEKGTNFVHTLNGSGLAVGRCLIAIIENYQNEDGSITIPEVLRPYMDGLDEIKPLNF